jgi:hypothetical protein
MNVKHPKKIWKIRHGDNGFYLVDLSGETVEASPSLRPLVAIAWNRGADEVVHDYDCSKYGI